MLTNKEMTFDDLTARFGEISAWWYLAEIEKAAGIQPRHGIADPEVRLIYALNLQDSKRHGSMVPRRETAIAVAA